MATATTDQKRREKHLLDQLEAALNAAAPAANSAHTAKRLLSIDEVCETLGVKKSYEYNAMNEGKLSYVALSDGRREFRRIRPEDLDEFLESRLISSA